MVGTLLNWDVQVADQSDNCCFTDSQRGQVSSCLVGMLIWPINGQASRQSRKATQVVLTNVIVECNAILPAGFERELNTGSDVPRDRLNLIAVMDGAFVVAVRRQVSIQIWVAAQESWDGRLPINLLSIVEKLPVKDDIDWLGRMGRKRQRDSSEQQSVLQHRFDSSVEVIGKSPT